MIINFTDTKKTFDNKEMMGFYIRTDPNDADSEKVKHYVKPYESGNAEDILQFVVDFNELIRLKSLDDDDGPGRFQMMRLLLKQNAISDWEDSHQEYQDSLEEGENIDDIEAFNNVLERWMLKGPIDPWTGRTIHKEVTSGSLKKPSGMTVTAAARWLRKVNRYLEIVPNGEALNQSELISVVEQMMPRVWLIDLMKKDNYSEMTFDQIVNFFKLMEGIDPARRVQKSVNTNLVSTNPYQPRRHNNYNGRRNGNRRTNHLRSSNRNQGNRPNFGNRTGNRNGNNNNLRSNFDSR